MLTWVGVELYQRVDAPSLFSYKGTLDSPRAGLSSLLFLAPTKAYYTSNPHGARIPLQPDSARRSHDTPRLPSYTWPSIVQQCCH